MTIAENPTRPESWVKTPFWRILGSFVSWFLFSLCMSLLLQGFLGLGAIGGSCASGGPYEIQTECPDAVALFMPLAVIGGLIAVAIGVFFGQGFGAALTDLAWPILFGSLGGGFLLAFFSTGDPVGLIVGGMFEIMAVIPLILALRVSPQRILLGAISARGVRFHEGGTERFSIIGMRYRRTDVTVRPDAGHWALSLIVLAAAVALGYNAALAAYASV